MDMYQKSQLLEKGYLVIKSFYDTEQVNKIIESFKIINKQTDIYFDRNNIAMRAENFYHKHQVLRKCNEDFAELLQNLLHQEMVIFKDKYNFKPPSGEGYFCHYDGIYKFKLF